jgi:hypothetical protein
MNAISDKDPESEHLVYNETTHFQSISVRELGKYRQDIICHVAGKVSADHRLETF